MQLVAEIKHVADSSTESSVVGAGEDTVSREIFGVGHAVIPGARRPGGRCVISGLRRFDRLASSVRTGSRADARAPSMSHQLSAGGRSGPTRAGGECCEQCVPEIPSAESAGGVDVSGQTEADVVELPVSGQAQRDVWGAVGVVLTGNDQAWHVKWCHLHRGEGGGIGREVRSGIVRWSHQEHSADVRPAPGDPAGGGKAAQAVRRQAPNRSMGSPQRLCRSLGTSRLDPVGPTKGGRSVKRRLPTRPARWSANGPHPTR